MSQSRTSHNAIYFAFLSVIAIMLAIVYLGLSRIHKLSVDLQQMIQERDVQIALMHTMRHAALERSITLQSLMIMKDPFMVDEYALQMSTPVNQYTTARSKLLAHNLTEDERNLLDRQHDQSQQTRAAQDKIIENIRNEDFSAASSLLLYTTLPSQRHAMAMMDEFIELKHQQNLDSLQTTSSTIQKTFEHMIFLGLLGVLFSGAVAWLVSQRISREIERRQNSEHELRHSELRERTIRENIIDGLLTLDSSGTILSCNKACNRIFGYSNNDLQYRSANLLMPAATFYENSDELDGKKLWRSSIVGVGQEVTGKRRDGSEFPAELDISRIILDGEPVYIAVVRDITEKKEADKRLQHFNQELERRVIERTTELAETNEKLRHEINERVKAQYELTHLATHDSLTGLPNRTMFNEQLEIRFHSASRHERNLALFFMDLDGFKTINDTHGHEVGDKLLVELANRLRKCVRKEDIIARMGGDEFTMLLSEPQRIDDVTLVAEKLIETVNRPFRIGDHICHVGISIGISLFPRCADTSDKLLCLADDAMYAAKEAGKNTFSFSIPTNSDSTSSIKQNVL